jgi:tetratricopeptide (TPR) repeat protein
MLVTLAALACAGCLMPSDPTGVYNKSATYTEAEALFTQKKFTEARERFRAVTLSRDSRDRAWSYWARFYEARCAHLNGFPAEAVRVYNDMLRVPKYPRLDIQLLEARADISLETGNYTGAASDYARARSLLERSGGLANMPVDREKLLFGEAMAYWSMAQYRESDRLFDKYLADYADKGRFIKEARDRHSKIGGQVRGKVKFYVLVGGSFRMDSMADQYAAKVRAKGFADVSTEKRPAATGFIYVVRVGAFENREEAHTQKNDLEKAGFRPAEVRP